MAENLDLSTFVKISDAAAILGVSQRQLQRWDKNHTLKAIRTKYGRMYYKGEVQKLAQMRQAVTRKSAAEQLGVNEKTLWRWSKVPERTDLLQPIYVLSGKMYYSQDQIDQYLKKAGEQ